MINKVILRCKGPEEFLTVLSEYEPVKLKAEKKLDTMYSAEEWEISWPGSENKVRAAWIARREDFRVLVEDPARGASFKDMSIKGMMFLLGSKSHQVDVEELYKWLLNRFGGYGAEAMFPTVNSGYFRMYERGSIEDYPATGKTSVFAI